MTFLADVSYIWGKGQSKMGGKSLWNSASFIMPYMTKQLAHIEWKRHSLPYYCPACSACIWSRNQKTDEGLIAVKNQCLSFSILIMTMNAGLLHLNTRMGIIHVEEIRHGTKGSSVRRVRLNISELLQNQCLRYNFNFPLLPFFPCTAELLPWRYTSILRQCSWSW